MPFEHDEMLRRLARARGLETEWRDAWGQMRQVSIETLRALLIALQVDVATPAAVEAGLRASESGSTPERLPRLLTAEVGQPLELHLARPRASADRSIRWVMIAGDGVPRSGDVTPLVVGERGEHLACRIGLPAPQTVGFGRLVLDEGDLGDARLAVVPRRCADVPGGRAWGIGVQLYGIRAPGDGGFGHFGALAGLARAAARQGAAAVGISPVHALFAADAGHYSPYAPSDRRFLNGLLADPTDIPGALAGTLAYEIGEALGNQLSRFEALSLIEYPDALIARRERLRLLFQAFAASHLGPDPDAMGRAFLDFRRERGAALENHARFEALHDNFFAADPGLWDWRRWPANFQHPDNAEVQSFALSKAMEVGFHAFLQWLSEAQLAAAQQSARDAGMSVGLIADMAVGMHAGGSRAWADREALLTGVSIGAPPDLLGPQGQNWGLAALSPHGLAVGGFTPFLDDLDAAMRYAGGVRLDHVMGLSRLWCIPEGATAVEGAYLTMPFRELTGLVALKSQERHCLVIGEDLGTVPEGFREKLESRNVLGIRVLWFEREEAGGFIPAERYPTTATATTSTHDLPTIMGWWLGRDIEWRVRLGHVGPEAAEALRADRLRDRAALWAMLKGRALVHHEQPPATLDHETVAAIGAFVGSTPAPLVLLPLEDALLMEEQPNLPGTTIEHPNWRRRVVHPTEKLLEEEPAVTVLRSLDAARKVTR